ncbi:MAG: 6-carboxytetrahydropterin synthase [Phycisphaerales bacterium]|nr:MAG: 6-carboxytetrahydropterin synthase [Phycisphaerales bacterium]
MYAIAVEAGFSAVHRLRLLDGTMEPLHGHDWKVRVHFTRTSLDDLGMVLDFAEAKTGLDALVGSLHHANLAEIEALAGVNPTAEVVARYVFDQLLAAGYANVSMVEVSEAPGCTAMYDASDPDPCADQAD